MNLSQNPCFPGIVRKYDLIIFDLDGTLLDTSDGIFSAVRYTVDFFHLRPIPDEHINDFIGPPIQYSFAKEYGVPLEIGEKYAAVFRERYKEHDLMKAIPYKGIFNALKNLNSMGCELAIATNKREDYAMELLNRFGFLEYCPIAHGSDFTGKQTKTDIIKKCIDEIAIEDKSRIAIVGDTNSDRVGAQESGIHFIGATYGFGFKKGDTITGSAGIIDEPSDLLSLVKAL